MSKSIGIVTGIVLAAALAMTGGALAQQPIIIKFSHVVAVDGPVGAGLFKKLESKGIVGLAYWDNGFKVMSANRPLRSPQDMKGLKMRIQSSKVLNDQMKALGALPQVMAFSEVYQGMQTGVV